MEPSPLRSLRLPNTRRTPPLPPSPWLENSFPFSEDAFDLRSAPGKPNEGGLFFELLVRKDG